MAATLQSSQTNNANNPQLKRKVYSKYRELLGSYNDKANTIIQQLPAYMVKEDRGFHFDPQIIDEVDRVAIYGAPPAPPPPSAGSLPSQRLPTQVSQFDIAPACVQNAMMTKDKKPFTYTPGGIDLSQIKSPRMAKRIAKNAQSEGVSGTPKRSPLAQPNGTQPQPSANTIGAAGMGMPFQVFPTGPPAPPPQARNGVPPPPPPMQSSLAPQTNGNANNNNRKSPTPQRFEPPPMGFRPEIKIPENPMAALKKIPKPTEKNDFWVEEYKRERSKSPMVERNDAADSPPSDNFQPENGRSASPLRTPQLLTQQQSSRNDSPFQSAETPSNLPTPLSPVKAVPNNEPESPKLKYPLPPPPIIPSPQKVHQPTSPVYQPTSPVYQPTSPVYSRPPEVSSPVREAPQLPPVQVQPQLAYTRPRDFNSQTVPPMPAPAVQPVTQKNAQVGSIYIPPVSAENLVFKPQAQPEKKHTTPSPPRQAPTPRWMATQRPTQTGAPEWAREDNVTPSTINRVQSPPTSFVNNNNNNNNSHHSSHTGLRLQMTSPTAKEHIIPIQLEQTPTRTPTTPGLGPQPFYNANQQFSSVSSPPSAGSAGSMSPSYIVRSPNQFVDQGYNNYPQTGAGKQQQRPMQVTSPPPQQDGKARIIPIAIEGQDSIRGPIVQQPLVIENDPRNLQQQNSWGGSTPNQSKSFRILQKITSTDAEGAKNGHNHNNVNQYANNDDQPAQLHRPQFARQMTAVGASSPTIDQMKRMQINEQEHHAFINRARAQQGQGPPMKYPQPPTYVQQRPFFYQNDQPQQQYVHPSEQNVPEPKKYTGSAIPSRSFKILQAMTTPENAAETDGSDVVCAQSYPYPYPFPYPYVYPYPDPNCWPVPMAPHAPYHPPCPYHCFHPPEYDSQNFNYPPAGYFYPICSRGSSISRESSQEFRSMPDIIVTPSDDESYAEMRREEREGSVIDLLSQKLNEISKPVELDLNLSKDDKPYVGDQWKQMTNSPSPIKSEYENNKIENSDDSSESVSSKGEEDEAKEKRADNLKSIKSVTNIQIYNEEEDDLEEEGEEEEDDDETIGDDESEIFDEEMEEEQDLSVIYEESDASTIANEDDEIEEDDNQNLVTVRLPLKFSFSRSSNDESITTVEVGDSQIEDESSVASLADEDEVDDDCDVSVTFSLAPSRNGSFDKCEEEEEEEDDDVSVSFCLPTRNAGVDEANNNVETEEKWKPVDDFWGSQEQNEDESLGWKSVSSFWKTLEQKEKSNNNWRGQRKEEDVKNSEQLWKPTEVEQSEQFKSEVNLTLEAGEELQETAEAKTTEHSKPSNEWQEVDDFWGDMKEEEIKDDCAERRNNYKKAMAFFTTTIGQTKDEASAEVVKKEDKYNWTWNTTVENEVSEVEEKYEVENVLAGYQHFHGADVVVLGEKEEMKTDSEMEEIHDNSNDTVEEALTGSTFIHVKNASTTPRVKDQIESFNRSVTPNISTLVENDWDKKMVTKTNSEKEEVPNYSKNTVGEAFTGNTFIHLKNATTTPRVKDQIESLNRSVTPMLATLGENNWDKKMEMKTYSEKEEALTGSTFPQIKNATATPRVKDQIESFNRSVTPNLSTLVENDWDKKITDVKYRQNESEEEKGTATSDEVVIVPNTIEKQEVTVPNTLSDNAQVDPQNLQQDVFKLTSPKIPNEQRTASEPILQQEEKLPSVEPEVNPYAHLIPKRFGEEVKVSVKARISAFETVSVEAAESKRSSLLVEDAKRSVLSRNNSSQRSESEIEEDDSGVNTDLNKPTSETDTESDSFPELRKMTRYQRAATHSRLFKLLQDDGDEDEVEAEEAKVVQEEFNFRPSRKKVVHNVSIARRNNPDIVKNAESMAQRRERLSLSLPLRKNLSIDADNPSSPNSPASPVMQMLASKSNAVSDQLVSELVESLLLKKNSDHLRNLPMEKLQAAAKRVLEEELDSLENTSIETTPAITPQGSLTDSYSDYYDSWRTSLDESDASVDYEILPSKAFRLLQENPEVGPGQSDL